MNESLEQNLAKVKKASVLLAQTTGAKRNRFLLLLAAALKKEKNAILRANELDARKLPTKDPMRDRLLLTEKRLAGMAASVKEVASQPDLVGQILEERIVASGLRLTKKRVPLGVLAIIYESRPNVTVEIVSLAVKSGNAIVLKGGKDAENSNKALVKIIRACLHRAGLPEKAVMYLASADRKDVNHLLTLRRYIDVVIPRGGQGLIDFVRSVSRIPIIETGAGVCHIYVDKGADIKKALRIVHNAKTSRPSVCNALDALLIHKDAADAALPEFTRVFAGSGVMVAADATGCRLLKQAGYQPLRRAKTDDFGTEFLRLEMAIKIVPNLDAAISHINAFGSGHSEAILSKNKQNIARFFREVDAACVYANASTRFTDGSQFGLGGEVGISTQKLHARGPLGAHELTTYKWLIRGQGQIRP